MTDTNPQQTDQAALRDRIAEALMRWAERNNDPKYAAVRRSGTVTANAYGRADAVLAVLPEPTGRAAIEAAVLRRAADEYDALANRNEAEERAAHGELSHDGRLQDEAVRDVANGLRDMADEIVAASGPGGVAGETQPATQAVHRGGNAEDCPACSGADLPYPWICPGPAAVSQSDGAETVSCSARPCNEAADELCDNHAKIKYHAEGEHAFCDPDCTEASS